MKMYDCKTRPFSPIRIPGTVYLFCNLKMGVRTRKFSRARVKFAYHLSHELGVSRAEIARQFGVCPSAIVKAIQNIEGAENKC